MNSAAEHNQRVPLVCCVFALLAACATLPDAADAPRPTTLASQLGLALQSHRDTTGSWPADARDFMKQIEALRLSAAFQADTVAQSMLPDMWFLRDLRFTPQHGGALRVNFRMNTSSGERFGFLVSSNKVTLEPGVTATPRVR